MKNQYNIILSLGIAFALIIGAIFATGTTSTTTAHAQEADCFCIQVYAPVCGVDGNTYGNSCVAQCANVPIAHDGECQAATPTPKPTMKPVPHKYPFSISTKASVNQQQFAWTQFPVNLFQSANLNMRDVNASGMQQISGTGRIGQQQSIDATQFWSTPFPSWHGFNW